MIVNPLLIVALCGFMLTLFGAIGAWAIRINKGESAADAARKAQETADAARAEIAEFKAHVAEHYASNKTLEQMERRLMDALANLGTRLDRLFHPAPPGA